VPGNSNYAGQSSVVEFSGQAKFVFYTDNAVHLYLRERDRKFAGGSRAAALYSALLGLQESQRYNDNRRAFAANKLRPFKLNEADLKALAKVVSGESVLAVHVDRAADIRSVLAALSEFEGIRPVLMGATEAWKLADHLAAESIPVVLNVLDNTPDNFDKLGARLDNAAILSAAGVRIAFMSSTPFSEFRSLTQAAGVAVANGLPFERALQAITSSPAQIWGLESLGVIEPDGIADLVIWDGDPLELMSAPVKTMINGKWVESSTRQSLLAKRYLSLTKGQEPDGSSSAVREK
jgi:imidazolonepropionase-like amidohydrolase